MLTIITNREKIKEIVERQITELVLPVTDYWTKRIVNLLGFHDSEVRTIIYNLQEGRNGTTEAERDVKITGGTGYVVAKVTIRIEQRSGEELFIMTIRDIVETQGVLDDEPYQEVAGMPNAPAVRVITHQTGFCRYCKQARMIEAPDGLSAEDLNDLASQDCDCDGAKRERKRRAKMEAAGEWAKNIFSDQHGQLQTVLCAIRSTFEGAIDYVTVKIGKQTHKIDTDSDGMIRIRTTYRDKIEEKF